MQQQSALVWAFLDDEPPFVFQWQDERLLMRIELLDQLAYLPAHSSVGGHSGQNEAA